MKTIKPLEEDYEDCIMESSNQISEWYAQQQTKPLSKNKLIKFKRPSRT